MYRMRIIFAAAVTMLLSAESRAQNHASPPPGSAVLAVTAVQLGTATLTFGAPIPTPLPGQDVNTPEAVRETAGIEADRVYLIRHAGRAIGVTRLALPESLRARFATLSPRGDLVAFSGKTGTIDRFQEVTVVDTSGAIAATFRGGERYAWSPSGKRLAVGYSTADSGALVAPYGIWVWDADSRQTTKFQRSADEFRWDGDETLLIDRYWGQTALSVTAGRVSTLKRPGINLSPDRRFSMGRDRWGTVRVWDDRTAEERFACCWATLAVPRLQESRQGEIPSLSTEYASKGSRLERPRGFWPQNNLSAPSQAFWVEASGAGHLLCVGTTSFDRAEPVRDQKRFDRASGIRVRPLPIPLSVVLDMGSEEVVSIFPGAPLGMTFDRTGIVVLGEDHGLRIEPVDPIIRDAARLTAQIGRSRHGKARVETLELRRKKKLGEVRKSVRAGQWLPGFLPDAAVCDRMFQVLDVGPDGRLRIQFPPGLFASIRVGDVYLSQTQIGQGEIVVGRDGAVFGVPFYLDAPPQLHGIQYEIRVRAED